MKPSTPSHADRRTVSWRAAAVLAAWCVLLLNLGPASALGPSNPQPLGPAAAPGAAPAPTADEQAEIEYVPAYLHLATGWPGADHAVYAWPFALESIGHAIQSYQYYGGSPYFHHGLDIMAPNGTDVFNRSGGQVVNVENYQPGNDLYWEVAVKDGEGYVWQYHHIDRTTIPQTIWNKWYEYQADPVNGGYIPADTYIGDIVWWPVGYSGAPTNFHHIHLNILGAGGIYLNGFEFHTHLNDTQVPEIQAIGLLRNGQIYPGNQVSGEYGLYVRARDLALSTLYWLPPFDITFAVDGGPATTTWRFDTLPGGADRYAFATDFYVVPPTCGDYDCNDFTIDLGFTPAGQRPFPSQSGPHTIVVMVKDYAGNAATSSFSWTVFSTSDIHTGDLDASTSMNPDGTWRANVTIAVHQYNHGPLSGATVTGRWAAKRSGLDAFTASAACITNSSGQCTITKRWIDAEISVVKFSVTGITAAGTMYNPAANHDPDGDSDGTRIRMRRP